MVYKISILGLPSSGKSTIMNYINKQINMLVDKPVFVEEYARRYIMNHGGIFSMKDQYEVTKTQSELEKEAEKSGAKVLLTESPVFNGIPYAKLHFCKNAKDLECLDKIEDIAKKHKYDLIFWCNPVGFYENDGVRYQKVEELPRLESLIRETMYKYHKKDIISLPKSNNMRELVLGHILTAINMREY